jgi:uncharacterized protein (TIGR02001 family)
VNTEAWAFLTAFTAFAVPAGLYWGPGYCYRGISQPRLDPALQGGIDFAHKSGFHPGTWASPIQWVKDAGGKSNEEIAATPALPPRRREGGSRPIFTLL